MQVTRVMREGHGREEGRGKEEGHRREEGHGREGFARLSRTNLLAKYEERSFWTKTNQFWVCSTKLMATPHV